jgi:hypothetical protein
VTKKAKQKLKRKETQRRCRSLVSTIETERYTEWRDDIDDRLDLEDALMNEVDEHNDDDVIDNIILLTEAMGYVADPEQEF